MNRLMSSTLRATTVIVRTMPRFVIELRPHGGDPHVVGQRRLELVEQLGPREGAPIDQLVGLTRVGRRQRRPARVDVARSRAAWRAGRPPAPRRCAACVASCVSLLRQLHDARDVEERRGQHDEPATAAARAEPRARCRTDGSRGSSGSCRRSPVRAAAGRPAAPACRAAPAPPRCGRSGRRGRADRRSPPASASRSSRLRRICSTSAACRSRRRARRPAAPGRTRRRCSRSS